MVHSIRVIRKEHHAVSKWAGGTTTQLAIYPENASYTDRNFFWRLSTAVVELEESTFTKLSGFDRILMVLEGELKLVHEEQHSITLKQYEQDSFKGGWNTKSLGRARDFNLMLRSGTEGSLKHYRLLHDEMISERLGDKERSEEFYACYCYKGDIKLGVNREEILLSAGDLLLVEYQGSLDVSMQGLVGTEVIETDIIIARILS